jgi:predicted Zn-dependent protease with MMP-like domain
MDIRVFQQYVQEAIASVPQPLRDRMENVVFVVEEDSRQPGWREKGIVYHSVLLGLYQGVPLTKRGIHYSLVPPDKITIFQKPIEDLGRPTEEGIKKMVFEVVHHEIGHYFGFNDAELSEMEKERGKEKGMALGPPQKNS